MVDMEGLKRNQIMHAYHQQHMKYSSRIFLMAQGYTLVLTHLHMLTIDEQCSYLRLVSITHDTIASNSQK